MSLFGVDVVAVASRIRQQLPMGPHTDALIDVLEAADRLGPRSDKWNTLPLDAALDRLYDAARALE